MERVKVTGNHDTVTFQKPYPDVIKERMSYLVKGSFFIPAVREGRWDGYKSMLSYHSCSTRLYFAMKQELSEELGIQFTEAITMPPGPKVTKATELSDREHQNECVDAMIASHKEGGGIILAATGSGKTRTMAYYYKRVPGNHLFVVDQRKLLHQAAADLEAALGEPVGIVGDQIFKPRRVTVCTVQTLSNEDKQDRLKDYFEGVVSIAIDELHKMLAKRSFELIHVLRPVVRFGMTATLSMDDKETWLRASALCGRVIYRYKIARGIEEGILTQALYIQIRFAVIGPTELKREGLDDWTENVLYHAEKRRALQILVPAYLRNDKHVVVLAHKLEHIDRIAASLKESTPMVIDGTRTKAKVRDHYIEQFETGVNRLLVASSVFNKGISIDAIDVTFNLNEMSNADTIVQQIGRGVRRHKDKELHIFIDFGGCTGDSRANAEHRLRAVRAEKIPTKVFLWERERAALYEFINPRKACIPSTE